MADVITTPWDSPFDVEEYERNVPGMRRVEEEATSMIFPRPQLPDGLPTADWRDDEFGVALYCRDSLEMVGSFPAVDSTITDPPYGVNLGLVKNGQCVSKRTESYRGFSDTPKYIEEVCAPVLAWAIALSSVCAMTPGNRCMFLYKKPDDTGVWWNPAGTSRGKWGPQCAIPIWYYGRDPRKSRYPSSPIGIGASTEGALVDHPCPKPLSFMRWLVWRASLDKHVVFDPFMGSGTTGVACVQLGRAFIGIEKEPKYFDIAVRRIREAIIDAQNGPLFATHEPTGQTELFKETKQNAKI